MKFHALSTAHAVRPSFMQKLIVLSAAALLAVASLGVPAAWADDAGAPTSLKGSTVPPVKRTTAPDLRLAAPDLPLTEAGAARERVTRDGKHTMTFYYYEHVHYEDPDCAHPDNLRLLYTRTVEGLTVGDVLDTWDYVDDIDGYFFWDAWPAKPVVSEDESRNIVELFYMNPEVNTYTVNYYRVSDETFEDEIADPTPGEDAIVEEIDGMTLRFEPMGSETIDRQYYNKKIVGSEIAPKLESMEYLESYPEAIRVQTNHEDNVINLLYTDDHRTLPDRVEMPSDEFMATPEAVPSPSQPAPGTAGPSATAPENGGTSNATGGSTSAPSSGTGNKPTATGPATAGPDDGSHTTVITETANGHTTTITTAEDGHTTTVTFAETGTTAPAEADLAQTGDATLLVAPLALVLAAATAALATLAYRRSR